MRDRRPTPLFDRLPGHVRSRDAAEKRPLQALMELFGQEIGILEQDIDQLYDNWFIETCEPWVLPYLAGLVGARPMRDIGLDQAGLLRAYIANVLSYRQAKGTAAVVEQVARDVSGWAVVAVEHFQNLATSQHVNHPRPGAIAFADLRATAAARRAHRPFDANAHAAAAGLPGGWSGRYNIPHLGIDIWRQSAAPIWPVRNDAAGYLGGAQPRVTAAGAGLLTFDPLGRALPLVNRPAPDASIAARMSERTVPAGLGRDTLFAALNTLRATGADPDDWFTGSAPVLRLRMNGAEVPPQQLFCCNLALAADGTWRRPGTAGNVMFDPELGRISLHPDDEGSPLEAGFAHASPFDIGGGAYDRTTSVQGWLGDFVVPGEPAPWQIGVSSRAQDVTANPDQGGPVTATLAQAIAAWNGFATEGSRGIIALFDNASYPQALTGAASLRLPKGARLAIVAAAWPEVALPGGVRRRIPGKLSAIHRRPHLKSDLGVLAAAAGEDEGARLVLDGLCLEGTIRLADAGDLGFLHIANCTAGIANQTLGPGLVAAAGNDRLSVRIERSILGRIVLPGVTGTLTISRSILGEDIDAGGAQPLALEAPLADAEISGATLFGGLRLRQISAENSLFTEPLVVTRRQQGCLRFCYLPPGSQGPRRFRCVPEADAPFAVTPVFTSTRFALPGFGQLGLSASLSLREGAEDGMEIGVGFANRDPARLANLMDVLAEFSPFGLTPGLNFIT